MDPVMALIIAVLGIALGIFASQATLGNKVTRVLTLVEESVLPRLDNLERAPGYSHRRSTDNA